jgi:hypothetical protein
MQIARSQLLAAAGLTYNRHRCIAIGNTHNLLTQRAHGGGFTDQPKNSKARTLKSSAQSALVRKTKRARVSESRSRQNPMRTECNSQ